MSRRERCLVARTAAAGALCAAAAFATDGAAYPQPVVPSELFFEVLDVVDADGDGLLDLLVGELSTPPMLSLAQGPLQYGGFGRLHPAVFNSLCFAAGDFNGDGHEDVAVGAMDSAVVLGSGDGGFPSARWCGLDAVTVQSVEVLDADADGDLDLLASINGPDGVQPLLGDGNGLLVPQSLISTPTDPFALAVGDVNLDGFPDFARSLVTDAGGTIQVAMGAGDGSFAPAVDYDAPHVGQIELVPLDGDDWLDLAWEGPPNGVRLSVGGGVLGPAQLIPGMPGSDGGHLQAVDVDEDTDLDLVVPDDELVFVAINDAGTLGFDPSAGCEAEGTELARDLDGDGAVDLAALTHEDSYYYGGGLATTVSMARGRQGQGFVVPLFSEMGGGYLDGMLVADLDGDGIDDLVLAEPQATRVCGGLGDGRFGPALVSITHAGYGTCTAKAAGDFDGDGRLDLLGRYATESIIAPIGVSLLLGQGDLTLTIGTKTPLSKQLGNLETCDLDLDGDLDTLSGRNGPGGLALLLNDGAGKFAVSAAPLPGVATGVAAGDVNADGVPDVAATVPGSLSIAVLLGNGSGALSDPVLIMTSGAGNVAIGDVDGDGRGDLAVGGYYNPPYAHELTVLRSLPGDDFGLLGVADPFLAGLAAVVMTVSDVTGDGDADVLLNGGTGFAVIQSDGFTGLAPAEAFLADFAALSPFDPATSARAVGRLDGDALPDVVSFAFKDFMEEHGAARTSLAQPAATWLGLGQALPGSSGKPLLSGIGSLQPHSVLTLRVTHAAPGAPAWLIAGASAIELPFKGGTLVPTPDIILGGLATDAQGELEVIGGWPDGVPAGASLVLQAWIADAIGPAGFSATNGLLLSPH